MTKSDEITARLAVLSGDEISRNAIDPNLVDAIIDELTVDERNVVLLMHACSMLPVADLRGRYRSLGLLNERSTLSRLGRAVAARILRR